MFNADTTLWFGSTGIPGARATLRACLDLEGPHVVIESGGSTRPSAVADWIQSHGVRALNVVGNRESKAPGIGERVERFMCDVFARLGHAVPTRIVRRRL